MRTLLAVIAGALLGGCAGSGGGEGTTDILPPPTRVITFDACSRLGGFGYLVCWSNQMRVLEARCPGLETECVDRELAEMNAEYQTLLAGGTDTLELYPPQAFVSWSQGQRPGTFAIPALGMDVSYEATETRITSVSGFSDRGNGTATLGYGADGRPFYFGINNSNSAGPTSFFDAFFNYRPGVENAHLGYRFENLGAIGQPGLDVARTPPSFLGSVSPFLTATNADFALVANPYALGWDYQSFGIWNQHRPLNASPWISANSFGAATPGSAVPTTGSATFTGKLAGVYVSHLGEGSIAFADLTVNADFGARTLGLSSTGTTLTRDLAATTAAPDLNLNGVLTYAAGSGTFSGTVHSAGMLQGSSTGRFYGPGAEELGGVFGLRSWFGVGVETFTGGYGAKR